MTSQELNNSEKFIRELSSRPLAERLAVIDYITRLFALLLQFAIQNFIVNGIFKQPSILRIGLYIRCLRLIIAIIKDIVAISKGRSPNNAFRVLE